MIVGHRNNAGGYWTRCLRYEQCFQDVANGDGALNVLSAVGNCPILGMFSSRGKPLTVVIFFGAVMTASKSCEAQVKSPATVGRGSASLSCMAVA